MRSGTTKSGSRWGRTRNSPRESSCGGGSAATGRGGAPAPPRASARAREGVQRRAYRAGGAGAFPLVESADGAGRTLGCDDLPALRGYNATASRERRQQCGEHQECVEQEPALQVAASSEGVRRMCAFELPRATGEGVPHWPRTPARRTPKSPARDVQPRHWQELQAATIPTLRCKPAPPHPPATSSSGRTPNAAVTARWGPLRARETGTPIWRPRLTAQVAKRQSAWRPVRNACADTVPVPPSGAVVVELGNKRAPSCNARSLRALHRLERLIETVGSNWAEVVAGSRLHRPPRGPVGRARATLRNAHQ